VSEDNRRYISDYLTKCYILSKMIIGNVLYGVQTIIIIDDPIMIYSDIKIVENPLALAEILIRRGPKWKKIL